MTEFAYPQYAVAADERAKYEDTEMLDEFSKTIASASRVIFLAMLINGECVHAAEEIVSRHPDVLAFNRGILDSAEIKKAEEAGIAKVVTDSGSRTVIQHVRWEVFENARSTTRDQLTLFIFGESEFYQTLPQGRPLASVRLQVVAVKFDGTAASSGSSTVTYTHKVAKKTDTQRSWVRTIEKGPSCSKFAANLPPWAKSQLWLTSGFLDQNPGKPVIEWEKTEKELLVSLGGDVLDALPLPEVHRAIDFIISIAKSKFIDSMRDAFVSKTLHYATGCKITDPKAVEFREKYERIGKKMWTTGDGTTTP